MKIHITGAVWHAEISGRLKRAFESLRHEVLFFDERGDVRMDTLKKILLRVSWRPFEVDDKFRARASEMWIKSIKEYHPNLIILEHAVNILPSAVQKIRELHIPIVYWITSPPDLLQSKDVLLSAHFSDYVFAIDRAWIPLIEHFIPNNKAYHLPLAGAPEDFHPLQNTEKIFDISFVGSFSPQYPDGLLRAYFISRLPRYYKIAIFGHSAGYWMKYFPEAERFVQKEGHISTARLNEIYNQSKIVLNIHSTGHRTSISARTFDTALSGAFQIIDWREDLEVLMPKGLFPTFRTIEEMNQLVEFWIQRPEERAKRVSAARKIVLKDHTWKSRVEMMFARIKS